VIMEVDNVLFLDFDQYQPGKVPAAVGLGIVENKIFGLVEERRAEGIVASYVTKLVEHVV
jgi:hypothetical protein